jgi:Sulfotransferase family.
MKKGTVLFVLLFLILLCIINLEKTSEIIEHGLFKKGPIHDFFQKAKDETYIPKKDKLIVFQHIPRTCGDSIHTHMFYNSTINYQSFEVEGLKSQKIEIFEKNKDLKTNASIIKGFFSYEDLKYLSKIIEPRQLQVFTILRHPYERLLSLKSFMTTHETSLEDFLKTKSNEWIQTFYNNSMTTQLGGGWDKTGIINQTKLLENAKENLMNMSYVGFFEFLRSDFDNLYNELFSHVEGSSKYRYAFNLGTFFGEFRLRTLRYSSQLTSQELKILRSYSEYDIMLYEWALEKYHPKEELYNSKITYLWFKFKYPIILLLEIIILAAIIKIILYFCDNKKVKSSV